MNRRIIAPLIMLATITTLTACTKQDIAPVSTGTETSTVEPTPVVPTSDSVVPDANMPLPTPIVEPLSGATTVTPSTSQTTTKVMTYQSPAGLDEIEFSATVDQGVITAASAKVMATNDASKYNQENFAKEVSAKVVGKAKKDFKVDTIGGASLTTAAFEKFVQSL